MTQDVQSGPDGPRDFIERGGWKFWIAEDGAVCMENEDGHGTAFSWNTFDTIYMALAASRRAA